MVVLSEFLGVYVLRSARLFLQLSISGLVVISAVKCFFFFFWDLLVCVRRWILG